MCLSGATVRSKNKDWFVWNQDNVYFSVINSTQTMLRKIRFLPPKAIPLYQARFQGHFFIAERVVLQEGDYCILLNI
jgi:hypothetical protein